MEAKSDTTLVTLEEGWHVLHLFYRLDRGRWAGIASRERANASNDFAKLVQDANREKDTSLFCYSVVGTRADIGIMLLAPELHRANAIQHQIANAFPAGALQPVASFFSVTELSEYMTSEEEFIKQMVEQEKLQPESDAFKARLAEWNARMAKYRKDRLYPVLPDKKVMAFYPMSKRRGEVKNWYMLDFAERKRLMGGHARVGRKYAGRILQLITGATGLDNWEWGVTLLADSVGPIKEIVYEMRFDEVSAAYAEFGPFWICLKLAPRELFKRLGL